MLQFCEGTLQIFKHYIQIENGVKLQKVKCIFPFNLDKRRIDESRFEILTYNFDSILNRYLSKKI